MAPARPLGGRALSAAGEPAAVHDSDPGRESGGQEWKPIQGEESPSRHGVDVRVSPDPLRTTDRYRLVTPYKLKL
jgi:hypothetical protein